MGMALGNNRILFSVGIILNIGRERVFLRRLTEEPVPCVIARYREKGVPSPMSVQLRRSHRLGKARSIAAIRRLPIQVQMQ